MDKSGKVTKTNLKSVFGTQNPEDKLFKERKELEKTISEARLKLEKYDKNEDEVNTATEILENNTSVTIGVSEDVNLRQTDNELEALLEISNKIAAASIPILEPQSYAYTPLTELSVFDVKPKILVIGENFYMEPLTMLTNNCSEDLFNLNYDELNRNLSIKYIYENSTNLEGIFCLAETSRSTNNNKPTLVSGLTIDEQISLLTEAKYDGNSIDNIIKNNIRRSEITGVTTLNNISLKKAHIVADPLKVRLYHAIFSYTLSKCMTKSSRVKQLSKASKIEYEEGIGQEASSLVSKDDYTFNRVNYTNLRLLDKPLELLFFTALSQLLTAYITSTPDTSINLSNKLTQQAGGSAFAKNAAIDVIGKLPIYSHFDLLAFVASHIAPNVKLNVSFNMMDTKISFDMFIYAMLIKLLMPKDALDENTTQKIDEILLKGENSMNTSARVKISLQWYNKVKNVDPVMTDNEQFHYGDYLAPFKNRSIDDIHTDSITNKTIKVNIFGTSIMCSTLQSISELRDESLYMSELLNITASVFDQRARDIVETKVYPRYACMEAKSLVAILLKFTRIIKSDMFSIVRSQKGYLNNINGLIKLTTNVTRTVLHDSSLVTVSDKIEAIDKNIIEFTKTMKLDKTSIVSIINTMQSKYSKQAFLQTMINYATKLSVQDSPLIGLISQIGSCISTSSNRLGIYNMIFIKYGTTTRHLLNNDFIYFPVLANGFRATGNYQTIKIIDFNSASYMMQMTWLNAGVYIQGSFSAEIKISDKYFGGNTANSGITLINMKNNEIKIKISTKVSVVFIKKSNDALRNTVQIGGSIDLTDMIDRMQVMSNHGIRLSLLTSPLVPVKLNTVSELMYIDKDKSGPSQSPITYRIP